jgi:hypothetical protein
MSHSISGKLFKAPFIKVGCGKDGQSTMFALKLSEKTKDFKTGDNVYANYDAVIYAQSQAQIEYYTNATAEGSFVVVSCEKLQPKISDCGKYVNLNMENARLENASYATAQQQMPKQTAPAYHPAPQLAPQQALLTDNEQSWLIACRNDNSIINQITDDALKAKIAGLANIAI